MSNCENCGCRVHNGACVNCDEEIFIADQYYDLDIPLPDESTEFSRRLREAELRQVRRLTGDKELAG